MADERSQSGLSNADLLTRLRSGNACAAWKLFLDRYAGIIMLVARQYESDADRADESYLYILEKLCENRFRRLLAFHPEGKASFPSWLKVVVANLCIDWRRAAYGRRRLFKSIARLPKLERQVFRYKFEQGLGFHGCLCTLQTEFPDLTESQLKGVIRHINEVLSTRQRWLLSARAAETVSLDDRSTSTSAEQVEDPGDDPEAIVGTDQQHERLMEALNRLTPSQRLLIKLRFQQELSLKEVARLTRLGDPFRARRQVQAALDELAKQLEAQR